LPYLGDALYENTRENGSTATTVVHRVALDEQPRPVERSALDLNHDESEAAADPQGFRTGRCAEFDEVRADVEFLGDRSRMFCAVLVSTCRRDQRTSSRLLAPIAMSLKNTVAILPVDRTRLPRSDIAGFADSESTIDECSSRAFASWLALVVPVSMPKSYAQAG
jgi:hypothetical protein